jgi:prolyl-tRNA synthetase
VDRQQFVATVANTLDAIQTALFERALALRLEHTRTIDDLDEFRAFFTPKNADEPEIHGGFALCHWVDDPSIEPLLNDLKVTIRCIPFEHDDEPGTCIFTGRPSPQRIVFAKAY